MNPRVLELLKNPKNIQSEDLDLLKEEINSFPYIQNVRALHLYGVHLYDKDNYQKELSTTAAYTTDKKILYQLINGKIQQKPKPEIVEEKKPNTIKNTFKYIHKSNSFPIKRDEKPVEIIEDRKEDAFLLQTPKPEIKDVYVNGERNRILFEGEENFLDDHNVDTIDLESTLESGSIVIQKIEKKEPIEKFTPETIINEDKIDSEKEEEKIDAESDISSHEIDSSLSEEDVQNNHLVEEKEVSSDENVEAEAKIEFTPEEIINEEEITSETEVEKVNNDAELSFHGTDSFLPDVKIESNSNVDDVVINEDVLHMDNNKHEDEMRRLIEEVEKKMKITKASSDHKEAEAEVPNHEISFGETQGFHVAPSEETIKEGDSDLIEHKPEEIEVVEESREEITEEKPIVEELQAVMPVWKPMSFDSHVPDSLLKKSVETSQPKIKIQQEEIPKQEEILPIKEEAIEVAKDTEVEEAVTKSESIEDDEDEAPAMNVSFFNSDIISSWAVHAKKEEKEVEEIKEIPTEKVSVDPVDSNVPGFINTWQSWLKIDRPSEEVVKVKDEVKNKVIESFIENNPRISQLKDEVNFVVKEKTDDISHLMTETLATLYFEQKLYTKAINAFYILINKHPGKKKYFEEKIQEIKDRGK